MLMHFIQLLQNRIPNIPARAGMLFLFISIVVVASACSTHTDANHSIENADEQHYEEQMADDKMPVQENPTSEEPSESDPEAADDYEDEHSDADEVTEPEPADREEELQEGPADDEDLDLALVRDKYDITDPESIAVLVNKTYGLSESYEPSDLVKVDIPFVYQDDSVHSLRQVAADAIIDMFEASKADGIELAGVSGYRSHAIQRMLYDKYVARDGEEAANKYSAKPGHSEHSTGLAMDVAGISGRCAANNCFAGTEEAIWVADHAHEFGFIIRYPLGKEDITGYQYEPWHLRYVGVELAYLLYENDWTMEEFFLDFAEANPS